MPLNHYKAGTWFQMEHREEIIGVGFIEDIMGERGDVKVRFIRRHGKACDERITVSGGTIVRRIEEPPNVLVELIKDDVIKTKTTRQVNVSDCLGCRPSAASGRINAAILAHKEPRSVEEISRDCGLPESRIKGHLRFWMDLANKDGYDRTHKVVEKPKGKFSIEKVKK